MRYKAVNQIYSSYNQTISNYEILSGTSTWGNVLWTWSSGGNLVGCYSSRPTNTSILYCMKY